MTERYFRCQNDACRKKWHQISMVPPRALPLAGRDDLFDVQEAATIGALPGTQCPACGADVEPEDGTFEELFRGHAA